MPLMAGLLVTSIASGNLISRCGRYKPFPIAGTALTVVALLLLSRIGVGTRDGSSIALYMLVLGLGLGMVMQVLVLAVQNSVDYQHLGVATASATMFRQIGGSIGVSLFGAIFANRLATNLADKLPAGAHAPAAANPAAVKQLPPAVHAAYVEAFAASLRPVFLAAGGDRRARVRALVASAGDAAAPDRGGRRRGGELRLAARPEVAGRDRARAQRAGRAREPPPRLRAAHRPGRRRHRARRRAGCSAASASARRSPRTRWPPTSTSSRRELEPPLDGLRGAGLVASENGGPLALTPDGRGRRSSA